MDPKVSQIIQDFITPYLNMDLGKVKINCPYWMNKIKDGEVVIRGQFNGKGESGDIKKALKKAVDVSNMDTKITQEDVFKIAKRARLGIDCSGLVYRVLDYILRRFNRSLDQVFPGGVNKTNARMLTDKKFNNEILKAVDIRPLDSIRMMSGKHVLLVIENKGQYIKYIHSSNKSTREKGVHTGMIEIVDPNANLDKQVWLEETPAGENFGRKYFKQIHGDGVRRLKIFKNYGFKHI